MVFYRINSFVLLLNDYNLHQMKVKVKPLSPVQLSEIPWTVAYQAPLSMRFSYQMKGTIIQKCHFYLASKIFLS